MRLTLCFRRAFCTEGSGGFQCSHPVRQAGRSEFAPGISAGKAQDGCVGVLQWNQPADSKSHGQCEERIEGRESWNHGICKTNGSPEVAVYGGVDLTPFGTLFWHKIVMLIFVLI